MKDHSARKIVISFAPDPNDVFLKALLIYIFMCCTRWPSRYTFQHNYKENIPVILNFPKIQEKHQICFKWNFCSFWSEYLMHQKLGLHIPIINPHNRPARRSSFIIPLTGRGGKARPWLRSRAGQWWRWGLICFILESDPVICLCSFFINFYWETKVRRADGENFVQITSVKHLAGNTSASLY